MVSIENEEGTVFWEALDMNRYVKALTNWWPVKFDITLAQEIIQEGSRLKVYVWKNTSPAVYIDKFSIEIFHPGAD